MKEHPILMSGPMIRAILEGKKTQTRRVMKPQPDPNWIDWLIRVNNGGDNHYYIDGEITMHINTKQEWREQGECPYGIPGDSLWVRETWAVIGWAAKVKTSELTRVYDDMIVYKADCDKPIYHDWRPSIFMPRWASRLTLEVTGVRVERVQDINYLDCIAEGIQKRNGDGVARPVTELKTRFAQLWDSINLKRGYGWMANPWVWVVEFKPVGVTVAPVENYRHGAGFGPHHQLSSTWKS